VMFERLKDAGQWKQCTQVVTELVHDRSWMAEKLASNWKPEELEKRWMSGERVSNWAIEGPG